VALRELSDRLVTLRRAVRSAQWNAVLAASLDAVGAAHAHLPAIADLEAEAAETLVYHSERAEAFATAFAVLAERDDRVEVVAKLRAQLTGADPGLAQRLEVVLARIEAGERTFPSLATTAIDTMVPTGAPADLAIAAASRGLRGLAHHAFNTVTIPPPDLGTALEVLEEFEGVVTHRESLLRDAQTRLFDAIKAGSPGAVVANEAQELAATVEQFAAGFAAAQARVAAVASALRDAGRGTDAEKAGMRLAAAGLLLREAFASHAAAVALGVELRRFRPSSNAQRVLDIDQGMVFDAALPSGRRTELAHLSTVADGTLVQIRGFATGFEQRRSADGKLLSQVTLLDPSSGSSAAAVGVFIHLPHAGVTEGAYVVVHGFARTSSPLLAGGAGVEIDVLPLVELAKRSWRLRLLELGALWAETWRNGLHIHWSLGPHSAADDDSPAANRGAAELVFTPFARERS
jgi:hypothetical protein